MPSAVAFPHEKESFKFTLLISLIPFREVLRSQSIIEIVSCIFRNVFPNTPKKRKEEKRKDKTRQDKTRQDKTRQEEKRKLKRKKTERTENV